MKNQIALLAAFMAAVAIILSLASDPDTKPITRELVTTDSEPIATTSTTTTTTTEPPAITTSSTAVLTTTTSATPPATTTTTTAAATTTSPPTTTPATTTTTTTAPAQPTTLQQQDQIWIDAYLAAGGSNLDTFLNVILVCESGGHPDPHAAISPTNDFGRGQINRAVWHDIVEGRYGIPFEQAMIRPDLNGDMSAYIEQVQGLTAWTCFR